MAPGHRLGFESLDEEVDTELDVEGDLPGWLDGSLVRNGPGTFRDGEGNEVSHWFDGLAMLQKFAVRDGGVRYRNRFLRTEAYRLASEGDLGSGFGTSAGGLLRTLRGLLFPEGTDNTNVNVAKLGGRYVAMTETPNLTVFDPETLDTVELTEYDGDPDGHITTAHPHHDDDRGETLNLLTKFGPTSEYRVTRQPDGSRRRELVASVRARKPAYMHSFGVTEEYVVLTEFPLVVHPVQFLLPGDDAFIETYDWVPDRGTAFVVLDRATGEVVARPRTDAFFAFHHVNAFEDDGELVLDVVTFPDPSPIGALYLDELRRADFEYEGGALTRFRLDLDAPFPGITSETLYEGGIGLPRCSPAVHRRDHRYVYGQGTPDRRVTEFPHELLKVDTREGTVQRHSRDDCYFSEPVFVPDPEGDREDSGVVLAKYLDVEAERSVFLALDGESFEERARAHLPHVLPFDFHGQFFPGQY